MAAEIGCLKVDKYFSWHEIGKFPFLSMADDEVGMYNHEDGQSEIPVLDFINKLRMSEEEARELEGDRVNIFEASGYGFVWGDGYMYLQAINGHKWELNEDRTEATLHKKD